MYGLIIMYTFRDSRSKSSSRADVTMMEVEGKQGTGMIHGASGCPFGTANFFRRDRKSSERDYVTSGMKVSVPGQMTPPGGKGMVPLNQEAAKGVTLVFGVTEPCSQWRRAGPCPEPSTSIPRGKC